MITSALRALYVSTRATIRAMMLLALPKGTFHQFPFRGWGSTVHLLAMHPDVLRHAEAETYDSPAPLRRF